MWVKKARSSSDWMISIAYALHRRTGSPNLDSSPFRRSTSTSDSKGSKARFALLTKWTKWMSVGCLMDEVDCWSLRQRTTGRGMTEGEELYPDLKRVSSFSGERESSES
jgi:hypothetical protein